MGIHANAKLGPAGRRRLVELNQGSTERAAAAALCVAPATAHRWSVRERQATAEERALLRRHGLSRAAKAPRSTFCR
jgi:hypothetical protein